MLNFELYSIYTEDDEYRGCNKEYFHNYDDAYAARMNYANWYRPNGDVWIRHYDKTGCHRIEEWHIDYDGGIKSQYLYGRNKK